MSAMRTEVERLTALVEQVESLKKNESQPSLEISVPPGSSITEPPTSLQPAMMPVSIIPPGPPIDHLERLPRHLYNLSTIYYFYGAVFNSSLSLLATIRNLCFFFPEQARQGFLPHPTSERMWLLRLGYFRLHEPLEPADDWCYLLEPCHPNW